MSNQRDAISKLAIFDDLTGLVLTFGSSFDLLSESVDTKDMYGLGFVVNLSRVLVGSSSDENTVFSFEDSEDDSVFSAVVDEGSLPYRFSPPDDNRLIVVVPGFQQTIGVFSTKRFVKVRLAGQVATSDVTTILRPFALSEFQEFTGYDPSVVPSDGLP